MFLWPSWLGWPLIRNVLYVNQHEERLYNFILRRKQKKGIVLLFMFYIIYLYHIWPRVFSESRFLLLSPCLITGLFTTGATSGTGTDYPSEAYWSSVTQVFRNGDGDHKKFEAKWYDNVMGLHTLRYNARCRTLLIKTYISNLVRMTHFWNNLHQVRSKSNSV